MNSDPTASRTHGVSPSASSATMPSAKKSDEAISPKATPASEGVSRTRWRPGSFLANSGRKVQPESAGDDQQRADEEPEPTADAARDRAHDQADAEHDQEHREDSREHRAVTRPACPRPRPRGSARS